MGRGANSEAELPGRDPLNECFWVSLSDSAAEVVEANAERIFSGLQTHAQWAPLNCDLASERWRSAFQKAGVDVELTGGYYNASFDPSVGHPGSSDHTWLLVEGEIFDPTAGQFAHLGRIETAHYYECEQDDAISDIRIT